MQLCGYLSRPRSTRSDMTDHLGTRQDDGWVFVTPFSSRNVVKGQLMVQAAHWTRHGNKNVSENKKWKSTDAICSTTRHCHQLPHWFIPHKHQLVRLFGLITDKTALQSLQISMIRHLPDGYAGPHGRNFECRMMNLEDFT